MTAAHEHLSRRERQIMDALYRQGQATVAEVRDEIPDPPGYSAVRAALRVLEEKGHVRHQSRGQHYVYSPTVPSEVASRNAARRLLRTFFSGSPSRAVAALLDCAEDLSEEELEELRELIDEVRREGR